MFKKYIILMLLPAVLIPMTRRTAAPAGTNCITRYPIVLVHGVGARDDFNKGAYWGRIPDRLRAEGARVYFGDQDAWRSHASNAQLLKNKIVKILAETGTKKVNIIAISKGGVESRYMISRLGMAPHVASLTTMATPHRGSSVADFMLEQASIASNIVIAAFEIYGTMLGDRSPDIRAAADSLTPAFMKAFNRACPDAPGVYYQSYAFLMKRGECNRALAVQHSIVLAREGPNDGLVSLTSARWGKFRGVIDGGSNIDGISHYDAHDGERRDMPGTDVPALYIKTVRELKTMGF